MTLLSTGAGPFLNSESIEDTKNQGSEAVQVWEGTAAQIAAKRLELIAAGATQIKYESKGDGNYSLRASWPYNTVSGGSENSYVDTLELETNIVQKSIYQSPVFRSYFSDFDSSTNYSTKGNYACVAVQRAHQILNSIHPTVSRTSDKVTAQPPKFDLYLYGGSSTPTLTQFTSAEAAAEAYLRDIIGLAAHSFSSLEIDATVKLFYEAAYMGVMSYVEFSTVFRRTVTAGNPAAIQANYAGSGMIWTSAEVSMFEGVPTSGGWFTLPSGKQWFKDKPRVLKAYGQKTQISYTYTEISTASALLYQAYGTAILFHTPS
jgi:hypothetical protein